MSDLSIQPGTTIDNFQLLCNIGQFDHVDAGTQIPLTKLTLIYAENGRGKTTLAAILRSLSTNDPTLITERKRLGSSKTPHIVLKINGMPFVFKDGDWSEYLAKIAIFDDVFVAKNVCSGIEIEAGHKQSLHELILGAEGVTLNSALQTLVTRIEEHNRELKNKGDQIPTTARGNLTVDDFCALAVFDDIDNAIQKAERNLGAAKSADVIRQKSAFVALELPAFDTDTINTLLQRTLPELQAEAADHVKTHIAKLGKDGETWVGDGMQRIVGASIGQDRESCPFCAQDLQISPLIKHYQAYFSKAYASLKCAIVDQGKAVVATHGGDVPAAFERAVRVAVQNKDFWGAFMEVPSIEIDTAAIARYWNASRDALLGVLRLKLASPLEAVTLSSEVLDAIATYNDDLLSIADLSKTLQACNAQIAIVKEKAAVANISTLTSDLTTLKAIKMRYSDSVAPLCLAYLNEKKAKKKTETERRKARQALDQYRKTIFSTYEATINIYLQKFNAGFRLGSVASVNHRGGSSCTYNVLINNVSVSLLADTGPSFRNTLSSGDRNALALAFFFASLDQDPQLAQKIVVIDDPMTSLDDHRSLTTVQEMRRLYDRVSQLLVLSHEKSFLCPLWEGADTTTRSALRVRRDGAGSTLEVWDVRQDCITENDRRHTLVADYIETSNPDNERAVAAALRHILESFMRVAYPITFPPGSCLGKFINVCRQRLNTSGVLLEQADIQELRNLLDYANKFHHDTNPAWETQAVNDQELLSFCNRTLKFAR